MGPQLSRGEQQSLDRLLATGHLRVLASTFQSYILRIIPAFFKRNGHLTSATFVRFWKSRLKAARLRKLLEYLFTYPDALLRLESFQFTYCHGPALDSFFETADTSSLSGISELSLVGCSMTSQKALTALLEPVGPVLTRLDLRGNFFESLPVQAIRNCRMNLERINLQGLMLGPEVVILGPGDVTGAGAGFEENIDHSKVSAVSGGGVVVPEDGEAEWSRLRYINFSENRFEELNLDFLPLNGSLQQVVAHHNNLRKVKFPDNKFPKEFTSLVVAMNELSWSEEGSESEQGLSRSLFLNHNTLTQISLHENNLNGEFRLENLPCLCDLGIASNQLESILIIDCPHLLRIDVCGNIVLSSIVGLDLCQELEELHAGFNCLTEEVLVQIQGLPRLQKIFLGYNQIRKIPQGWFQEMKYLVYLDLSGNGLGPLPKECVRMGCGEDEHILSKSILFWGDNDPNCWGLPPVVVVSDEVVQDGHDDEEEEDAPSPLLFPMKRLNSGLRRFMIWGNMFMSNAKEVIETARRMVDGENQALCTIELAHAPIPNPNPNPEEGEEEGEGEEEEEPSEEEEELQWGTFPVILGDAERQIRFGFAATKGPYRQTMEDAHSFLELEIPVEVEPDKDKEEIEVTVAHFLGIFDGHAGSLTSVTCAREMPIILENSLAGVDLDSDDEIKAAIVNAVDSLDALLRRRRVNDGTTVIAALFLDSKLVIINIGDSRAIAIRRDGSVEELSTDQKANSVEELRLLKLQGDVVVDSRVNGSIAVARSMGDFACGLSHQPEIRIYELDDLQPRRIVLACDGVWDVMTNEMAGHAIESMWPSPECTTIQRKLPGGPVRWMAWRLVNLALSANSRDNVSSLVMEIQ